MAKHSIQIDDDKLFEEIVSYCKLNKISIKMFCTDMLRKQFLIEKFGDIPFGTLYSAADENKITTTAIIKKENNDGDYERSAIIEIQTDKDGENKTIEVIGIRKDLKQPSDEVVFVPLEMEEPKPLSGITVADKKVLNRYTTVVDPSFYSEILLEGVSKETEEIQKHTEKPKKRRL